MFWDWRHTNFNGGGLQVEQLPERKRFLSAPSDFSAPEYIDSRPYCLPASNQGCEPACVGYAIAGYCEIKEWRETHHARQIDGLAIYRQAKAIDDDDKEGTSFTSGVQAAKDLCLLEPDLKLKYIRGLRNIQFALHTHGVVLGAFMVDQGWNKVNRKTGWISGGGGKSLGAHAVLLCWYYETDKISGVGWQNSWKATWGCHGFGRCTGEQFKGSFIYGVVLE